MSALEIPRLDLTHPHRVTVVIGLECGAERTYVLQMESVARNPAFARPGVQWACSTCTPGPVPSKRIVVRSHYEYSCQACEAETPDETPGTLPESQAYQWKHDHGPVDTAGYVIVRSITGTGGGYVVEDVADLCGRYSFGLAAQKTRQLSAEHETAAFALVPVYTDGCRLDRI